MGFEDVPDQVKVVCDGEGCGAELEGDGCILYFDKDKAADECASFGFEVWSDGRVLCEECLDEALNPEAHVG